MKKLTIVGVIHGLDIKNQLPGLITKGNREIVCVELDEIRYKLLKKYPLPCKLKEKIFLKIQHKIEKMKGIIVGKEMIDVTNYVEKRSIPFRLIDVDYFEISKMMRESLGVIGRTFIGFLRLRVKMFLNQTNSILK